MSSDKSEKYVDKIFYINLDRRPDRKQNMEIQLRGINTHYPVERVSAVDGRSLEISDIPSNLVTDKGKKDAINQKEKVYTYLTLGAIGCAFSHRNLYIKILRENLSKVLILEDDVSLADNFITKLEDIMKNIPENEKNYDIIYIGYHPIFFDHDLIQLNDHFFKPKKKIYGLFGYIVTDRAAKKLLEIFPITMQIDSEIANNFDKINPLIVAPEKRIIFSDQSSVDSTYGTDIQIREGFDEGNCDSYFGVDPILMLIIIVIFSVAIFSIYIR